MEAVGRVSGQVEQKDGIQRARKSAASLLLTFVTGGPSEANLKTTFGGGRGVARRCYLQSRPRRSPRQP